MTQTKAAEVLEVTPQTVRNWETGRNEPPEQAVRKMAILYGLTVEKLLEDMDTTVTPARHRPGSRYSRVAVNPEKMYEARRSAGLTQNRISELTGLSPNAVSRYETGRANPAALTLEALAGIYGRPAEWFTPAGQFTGGEREQFEKSVNQWPDRKESADATDDIVTDTYHLTRQHLSEESKLKIANFILFISLRQ